MSDTEEQTFDPRDWSYEFKAWEPQFGSPAVAIVKQEDKSAPYEMDRATLFRLKERGVYALVVEEGCSCYEVHDAQIDVIRGKQEALAAFDRWHSRGY